jgi:tellurite methyltransferase
LWTRNLSIAAAAKGCRVTAVDASPAAIADLARRAAERNLSITARRADLRSLAVDGTFDSVVAIGLLMFFPRDLARKDLQCLKALTTPDGITAVNVLIEGTTYLDMFEPNEYHLFSENEVADSFAGWTLEYSKVESFPAPSASVKRFCTLVARRPID